MTPVEKRILENQAEIMWTLSYLVKAVKPNLVGNDGEVDRMRDDLRLAARDTLKLVELNR